MKPFNFRLEPLLRLRRQTEEQKKRAVADLIARINHQQQQALQLDAELKRQGELLKQKVAQGSVDLQWIAFYRTFVVQTRKAISVHVQRVAGIQQRLTQARAELAHAAQQCKILEKLREKRKQRYQLQQKRVDANMQDEVAANIFLRKNRTA